MPTVVTDRDAFRETARTAPDGARVPVEVRVDVADPFDAYRRARGGPVGGADGVRPGSVFVETTGGQSGWGYFAVDPVRRLQVGSDLESDATVPTLAELRGLLDGEGLVRGDCDVPYPCGAFGWLSYDVARELEELPGTTEDDRGFPRLQLGVYDTVAAWEPPTDGEERVRLRVTSCPRVGTGDSGRGCGDGRREDGDVDAAEKVDDDVDAAYERGLERAGALARAAVEGAPGRVSPPVATDAAEFTSDCTREAFADRVRRVKEYVREGDTFQANVSQRLTAPAAVHPVAAYAALRQVNPAPYSALLEFPGVDLASASPELLLEVEPAAGSAAAESSGESDRGSSRATREQSDPRVGDRFVTEPIAGTRPRGETPGADADLEADLLGDEKERAEHAMLVDLERNDLGKVAAYGSVEVTEYRRVDRYAEVMHLVSLVEARLRSDADLVDAVAAVFPGGTITGAPKPRTMEIIDEVEATRRGPYTGSIGLFGFDGRATLNIIIRTLVRRGDEYGLRVGAGIVHDSEPDREYEETLDKGRALVTAVDRALGDRADLDVEDADPGVAD